MYLSYFSQSLFTLNLIEDFLAREKVPRWDMDEYWCKNKNYFSKYSINIFLAFCNFCFHVYFLNLFNLVRAELKKINMVERKQTKSIPHTLHCVGPCYMGRVKRIWYLPPMRAAKVQASLCIRAVSPEPPLLAHTSSESRGTFRQKARSLASLNGLACAVKICHDIMLEDTNSLNGAHIAMRQPLQCLC